VLQDLNPGDCEDVHAVFLGQGGPLPARVRAFIDFLGENIQLDNLDLERTRNGEWRVRSVRAQLR
jgi:hypothetical protein